MIVREHNIYGVPGKENLNTKSIPDPNSLVSSSSFLYTIKIHVNLVEFFVELTQLCHLLHNFFAHEERSVQRLEALLLKHPQRQIDQRLLQEHCRSLQHTQLHTHGYLT